jgi:hypothetical protein
MRAIAFLALLFGFMMQLILDGQPFSHAVFGIACGVAAIACGLRSSHIDRPNRWEGRVMAGLGFALAVWCVVMLPSASRTQEKFNDRRDQIQKMKEHSQTPNQSLEPKIRTNYELFASRTAAPLLGLARLPFRAAGSSGCGSALIR